MHVYISFLVFFFFLINGCSLCFTTLRSVCFRDWHFAPILILLGARFQIQLSAWQWSKIRWKDWKMKFKKKWAKGMVSLATVQGKIWVLSMKVGYLLLMMLFFRTLPVKYKRYLRENPNCVFQSLKNAPAELKHCIRQSPSILRPEAKRARVWWQNLQVHKNAVQRIKFTVLSYTLREVRTSMCWVSDAQSQPLLKARGHISNCHTLGHRSVLGLQKRASGKSKFRVKPSALSSWYVYPDFCLLYTSARIKNSFLGNDPGVVRSEQEQWGQRLICAVPGSQETAGRSAYQNLLHGEMLLLQRYVWLDHKRHGSMFLSVCSQTDFTKISFVFSSPLNYDWKMKIWWGPDLLNLSPASLLSTYHFCPDKTSSYWKKRKQENKEQKKLPNICLISLLDLKVMLPCSLPRLELLWCFSSFFSGCFSFMLSIFPLIAFFIYWSSFVLLSGAIPRNMTDFVNSLFSLFLSGKIWCKEHLMI